MAQGSRRGLFYGKKDISGKNRFFEYFISKNYANEFIDQVILIIIKSLQTNKTIHIKNFGSFKVVNKKERIGRNPKNKKTYTISKRNIVSFKPSLSFKNKINNA